jgi:D-glycero-alpha-D-manno-heptose-7-phosphate kinase
LSRATVRASAPARIDLAGGTLDIWPVSMAVPGARTVNVAIELRAVAEVEPLREPVVQVISRDRRRRATRKLPLTVDDCRGPLTFLLRVVHAFAPRRGLKLTVHAESPAGAGLGGSSTLGIAVAGALNRFEGAGLDRRALIERVVNVEVAELGTPTGNQDQLAAVHGGLAAYVYTPDGPRRDRLPLHPDLGQRLVLAYTGGPRRSGMSNWDMVRRFIDGERRTVKRMHEIGRIARELSDAFRAGDLDAAGRLVGEEGRLRYRLAPSVATPALLEAGAAARRAGALGVKVCGAGGGGCLVAFAREGRSDAVAEAMQATGARLLPAEIARRGLTLDTGRVSSRRR